MLLALGERILADDSCAHDAKLLEALAHGFPYPRAR